MCNGDNGKYMATSIELDTLDDMFFIKEIKKTNKGYEVEIVEYLEDYKNAINVENEKDEEKQYDIEIKNLKNETVAIVSNTDSETKVLETVKDNIDKFTKKKILLEMKSENLYIRQVG